MIGRCVVVGVEDTPASGIAARVGQVLAEAAGGKLHLVAAVSDPLADAVAVRIRLDPERVHGALLESTRRAIAQRLAGISGAPLPVAVVRLGRPEHVLASFADEVGADLVVLGGRDRDGPTTWFRRGTAHHLLRTGRRPVLVTGPGAPLFTRVVAALDRSASRVRTATVARELARHLGLPLDAVHVVDPAPLATGRVAGLDAFATDGLIAPVETVSDEDELWDPLPPSTPRRVLSGRPLAALTRHAREVRGTLMVVGAQGRGRVDRMLLGSVSEGLLAELPASLAVVPDPAEPERPSEGGSDLRRERG